MSWYNDLHDGLIPGCTEHEHDEALLQVVEWIERKRKPRPTSQSGDGIQPYSKGEFYPWVWTCIDNFKEKRGEMFYIHPDGRKSAIVRYSDEGPLSFREANQLLDDIMGAILNG